MLKYVNIDYVKMKNIIFEFGMFLLLFVYGFNKKIKGNNFKKK